MIVTSFSFTWRPAQGQFPKGPDTIFRAAADAYALGGMIDEFLTQLYLRQDPALSHLAGNEEAVADLLTELWCLCAYGRLPPEGG